MKHLLENEAEIYKGKLPREVEDRFDKEFPRLIVSINESPVPFRDERVETDGRVMKKFIAQILQEERERIIREIEKEEVDFIDTEGCNGTAYSGWCCPKHKGFNIAKETFINLIKQNAQLDKAPEYDGHTSDDVLERLKSHPFL